ncbi:hypothetical protein [Rhodopirellula sp. MGV]|uniref:hypothetical protein n=1 Tax=Rhodopirellula sp. MGV TaxID=2023130 RepID=UPI000B965BE7|nr:hypothetical protein [Rhodopirellula sp. MGV]OYP29382.1 hypothetical protein CGZ80_24540 [Rhodopirellula sp. MGV]PNY35688.1 hypothetical protein C2E31_16495 [Rhodopirellula baltica]
MTHSFERTASKDQLPTWTTSLRSLGGKFAITIWAVALSVITSLLMVAHWVALPKPEPGSKLSPALLTDIASRHNELQVIHVINLDCPCSRRVLRHLLDRSPSADVDESMLLVGQDRQWKSQSEARGYRTTLVSPEQLTAEYGIESSPLLLAFRTDGELLYSGGYTARKQGLGYQDESIIASLQNGETIESLPVYGCAISRDLQDIVDPLRLKYKPE